MVHQYISIKSIQGIYFCKTTHTISIFRASEISILIIILFVDTYVMINRLMRMYEILMI